MGTTRENVNLGGRPNVYTPEEFAVKSMEYFKWCEEHPLYEEELVKYKDTYEKVKLSKMRAFTIQGLCIYLNICSKTFYNLEKNPEYLQIITRVRDIIYNQKFEGSAANLLNSNIIARDLGLTDKTENTVKVEQPLFGDE